MHDLAETSSTVEALAAVVRGESRPRDVSPEALVDSAIRHRLSPLVARARPTLDAASEARLDADVRLSALHGGIIDHDLTQTLDGLAAAGVAPLVIKGAHLAHSLYTAPGLRPRLDSDLLIPLADRHAAESSLLALGYRRGPEPGGRLILGTFHVERTMGAGVQHHLDVHWRAAAPLVFAGSFDAGVLAGRAEPIPGLGAAARGPDPADALALACVHVVAHHWHGVLLIWLHDIALLAGRLDASGLDRFVQDARRGRYTHVAYCALDTARHYFGSPRLEALLAALGSVVDDDEPSAALAADGRRKIDDLLLDVRALGWWGSARLIREHVLPTPTYMRGAFGDRPLPLAYAGRLVRGMRRWFDER